MQMLRRYSSQEVIVSICMTKSFFEVFIFQEFEEAFELDAGTEYDVLSEHTCLIPTAEDMRYSV